MTNVVIDDVPRLDEAKLAEHLLVCDKSGRVLGHDLPVALYERLFPHSSGPKATTEELNRRLNEPGGKSLAEIFERLENA